MTIRSWLAAAACLLSFLSAAPPLYSHPISISRASVYLTRQRATVQIESFLEDLYLFHQLQPSRADYLEIPVIEQGIKLHEQFLRQRFELTDVEGRRYEPQKVESLPVDLPAEGVPLADLMSHQLLFQLEFDFAAAPEILTFTQRFTEEADVLPSEIGLRIQQENGDGVVEHALLPLEPYSLRIDWQNPPLSPAASQRERDEWAARERQVLLGITDQSGVYSFLYVEDYEVRHEILVPAAMLDAALDLPRDADAVLDLAEQEAASRQIADYFASGNPITIDDRTVEPIVERCEFFGLDRKDFAGPTENRPAPLANARVGLILSYPLSDQPQRLRMTWDRFNDRLWGVTTVVIAGDELTREKLTRVGDRNVLEWRRADTGEIRQPLQPIPANIDEGSVLSSPAVGQSLVGLLCLLIGTAVIARKPTRRWLWPPALVVVGCFAWHVAQRSPPELPDADAIEIFYELHANMYESFSRRTEESIYDSLAASVAGDLLRDVYLEVRRGLMMQDQGGAVARIDEIDWAEAERIVHHGETPPSFRLRCRWNVSGTVEHWGHRHRRTNQYQAEFMVAPADGFWKLVEMDLIDEQRLNSETTVRSL